MRIRRPLTLAAQAGRTPLSPGVYRLYHRRQLLHVGMAAGRATLRSEILSHARGAYGPRTQRATRVRWEVARDAHFAQRRFVACCAAFAYAAGGPAARRASPSTSRRYSSP